MTDEIDPQRRKFLRRSAAVWCCAMLPPLPGMAKGITKEVGNLWMCESCPMRKPLSGKNYIIQEIRCEYCCRGRLLLARARQESAPALGPWEWATEDIKNISTRWNDHT